MVEEGSVGEGRTSPTLAPVAGSDVRTRILEATCAPVARWPSVEVDLTDEDSVRRLVRQLFLPALATSGSSP